MSVLPPDERRSILLIDDDELIAGSLRHALSGRCDVDTAPDAAAASMLMTSRRYDVILVDPYLTGGVHREDGDLIAVIRDLQPDASLIVLTGYGSAGLAGALSDARVSAILTKPQPVAFLNQFVLAACSREALMSQSSTKGRP